MFRLKPPAHRHPQPLKHTRYDDLEGICYPRLGRRREKEHSDGNTAEPKGHPANLMTLCVATICDNGETLVMAHDLMVSFGSSITQTLGGHLKTGHAWTLQNRPTEQNQNKSIYTLLEAVQANTFFEKRSLRGLY